MIYDESLVRLNGEKMAPGDGALMFACLNSKFTPLCDEIFGEDDVASKMVFNLILNFIEDTDNLDMFDVRKIVNMPKRYWAKWDKFMREIADIPTPGELESWFGEK